MVAQYSTTMESRMPARAALDREAKPRPSIQQDWQALPAEGFSARISCAGGPAYRRSPNSLVAIGWRESAGMGDALPTPTSMHDERARSC